MNQESLIYDWNELPGCFDYSQLTVELCDETLRDGLQNPSVVDPPIQKKIELLHIMEGLGIHSADIGLPGAGPRAYEAVHALGKEILATDLRIKPIAAARTVRSDIEPVSAIQQELGLQFEVATFIGSSPIQSTRASLLCM